MNEPQEFQGMGRGRLVAMICIERARADRARADRADEANARAKRLAAAAEKLAAVVRVTMADDEREHEERPCVCSGRTRCVLSLCIEQQRDALAAFTDTPTPEPEGGELRTASTPPRGYVGTTKTEGNISVHLIPGAPGEGE